MYFVRSLDPFAAAKRYALPCRDIPENPVPPNPRNKVMIDHKRYPSRKFVQMNETILGQLFFGEAKKL